MEVVKVPVSALEPLIRKWPCEAAILSARSFRVQPLPPHGSGDPLNRKLVGPASERVSLYKSHILSWGRVEVVKVPVSALEPLIRRWPGVTTLLAEALVQQRRAQVPIKLNSQHVLD